MVVIYVAYFPLNLFSLNRTFGTMNNDHAACKLRTPRCILVDNLFQAPTIDLDWRQRCFKQRAEHVGSFHQLRCNRTDGRDALVTLHIFLSTLAQGPKEDGFLGQMEAGASHSREPLGGNQNELEHFEFDLHIRSAER